MMKKEPMQPVNEGAAGGLPKVQLDRKALTRVLSYMKGYKG